MKSLAFAALSLVASAAMAGVSSVDEPEITISGNSVQAALLSSTTVRNTAGRDNTALQNLASNAGNITISGNSLQAVSSTGSALANEARGDDAYAAQNLSSNVGDVTVSSTQIQLTTLSGSTLTNLADGSDSVAVQNIASNNSCFSCPTRRDTGHGGTR